MPMIAKTLLNANSFRQQFGLEQNSTWNEMAANVLVLREDGVTLEYTTMNGSAVVKQADVVLNTFPLDYNNDYSERNALTDLDYVSEVYLVSPARIHADKIHSTPESNPLMGLP